MACAELYITEYIGSLYYSGCHLLPLQDDSIFQGRSIGIALGCLIGMFPLLFFKEEEEKKESTDDTNTDSLSTGSVATSQSTQSETSKAAS